MSVREDNIVYFSLSMSLTTSFFNIRNTIILYYLHTELDVFVCIYFLKFIKIYKPSKPHYITFFISEVSVCPDPNLRSRQDMIEVLERLEVEVTHFF